jgi:diguanylate cyclase (GGDEF)-like protein
MVGLLYLEAPSDLPEDMPAASEIYLEILAENISLAVGNLRLRDKLRAMAMSDPLTGLANRRQLETVLEPRLTQAGRDNECISCIMLDVDHFKHFNDQFGHDAGDAVLRAVGELLRKSTRDNDAFRYGGEEFVLLLPGMGTKQAVVRAEEIRNGIESLRIEHRGYELGSITASLGVATAPDQCAFRNLVQIADTALLRAKEAGRNRVMLAQKAWTNGGDAPRETARTEKTA